MKGVLAHIYSDGGHCVKSGRAGHGGAPFLTSPRRTLRTVGGGSAAGPSHSRTSGDVRPESAKWAKADIDQVSNTETRTSAYEGPNGSQVAATAPCHCPTDRSPSRG